MARVNSIENIQAESQHEWKWQVAIYLYLAGIGAGSLAVGILVDWLGYVSHPLRAMLLWGSILVALGALFLVLKLGIKRRFLNTVLNPRSSWLTRGFYILSACIIVGALIFGISLLPFLNIDISSLSSVLLVFEVIEFVLALATAVYTGILIQSIRYVPLWNTPILPVLFTVSSLSTGSMAIILSALGYSITPSAQYPTNLMDTVTLIEQVCIAVEAVVLVIFFWSRYGAEQGGKASVRLLMSGKLKWIFWIGIVVTGFLFPFILEIIYSRLHDRFLLILTGIFLLTGGLFLRLGIIYGGVKNKHPMHQLIEMRYNVRPLSRNR